MTGEVATYADARERIDRIKSHVVAAWADIVDAYRQRDWITLGYADWDTLCAEEFGGARIALPVEDRQQIVADLRGEGLSTRAIGSAIGASDATVRRDIAATASDVAVDTITGLDGRTRPAHVTQTTRTTEATKVEHAVDLATGEILDGTITSEQWDREAALAAALAEFPALNVDGADLDVIVTMADGLRGMPVEQRAWRAENARKWLTAKVAGRLDPQPERVELWPPVFRAITDCIRAIRNAGGPEALVAELGDLMPVERENNLGQLADLIASLDAITPQQGLRRIK